MRRGIDLAVKPGDLVRAGDVIATLHADDSARFAGAIEALDGAFTIGEAGEPLADSRPLVLARIG